MATEYPPFRLGKPRYDQVSVLSMPRLLKYNEIPLLPIGHVHKPNMQDHEFCESQCCWLYVMILIWIKFKFYREG